MYIIKHEDFSCYNYVFYITTTHYLPCNNNNINRKELYDFYYTAITLTMGYKHNYRHYRHTKTTYQGEFIHFSVNFMYFAHTHRTSYTQIAKLV